MATLLKILATLLGGIALAKTLLAYRAKEESFAVSLFWLFVWLAIIVVAWRPLIIDELADAFSGQATSIGQIAGIGFTVLVFALYRIYLKTQRLEQKITAVIRERALNSIKRPTK